MLKSSQLYSLQVEIQFKVVLFPTGRKEILRILPYRKKPEARVVAETVELRQLREQSSQWSPRPELISTRPTLIPSSESSPRQELSSRRPNSSEWSLRPELNFSRSNINRQRSLECSKNSPNLSSARTVISRPERLEGSTQIKSRRPRRGWQDSSEFLIESSELNRCRALSLEWTTHMELVSEDGPDDGLTVSSKWSNNTELTLARSNSGRPESL